MSDPITEKETPLEDLEFKYEQTKRLHTCLTAVCAEEEKLTGEMLAQISPETLRHYTRMYIKLLCTTTEPASPDPSRPQKPPESKYFVKFIGAIPKAKPVTKNTMARLQDMDCDAED